MRAARSRRESRWMSWLRVVEMLAHMLAMLGVKGADCARIISSRLAFWRVSYSMFSTAGMSFSMMVETTFCKRS